MAQIRTIAPWMALTAALSIGVFDILAWSGYALTASGANVSETAIEHVQHFTLLGAAVLAALAFRRSAPGLSRWAWLGLSGALALLLIEELNWGQTLLNFGTPAAVAEVNAHDELSLHNLDFMIDWVRMAGLAAIGAAFAFATWRALANPARRWEPVLAANALYGGAMLVQVYARLLVYNTQGFVLDELAENAIYAQILLLTVLFLPVRKAAPRTAAAPAAAAAG